MRLSSSSRLGFESHVDGTYLTIFRFCLSSPDIFIQINQVICNSCKACEVVNVNNNCKQLGGELLHREEKSWLDWSSALEI